MFEETNHWPVSVALLLVFSGLSGGIGLVGTAAAQDDECNLPRADDAFITVANPAGDTVTATELYGVTQALTPIPDDGARNGVDAHEVDLGCTISEQEEGQEHAKVCVEPYNGFEDGDDVFRVTPTSLERQQIEVKFRNSFYQEIDPIDATPLEGCGDLQEIPAGTQYVIFHLSDGLPRGVHADTGSAGSALDTAPYSAWFCYKLGTPSSCPTP